MPNFIDYILSPQAVRERSQQIFELCKNGATHFIYHSEKCDEVADFVIKVIKDNYPDLKIPYHSRWNHFNTGQVDRLRPLRESLQKVDPIEKARAQIDLAIISVLLDAGAGPQWSYLPTHESQPIARSEGLAVASLDMFLASAFSESSRPEVQANALQNLKFETLQTGFQVTTENPIVGLQGRLELMHALGLALKSSNHFVNDRPGGLVDTIVSTYGYSIKAEALLRLILDSLSSIWPQRLHHSGVNLGDTWVYPPLGNATEAFLPFHKLSQWLTYSLFEPLEQAGFTITDVDTMTGLAEYRNGGLMIDSGLLTLRDPSLILAKHPPDSAIILEWRALTICLLDVIGQRVQDKLNISPQEFPLVKILEGGTWWAGRKLAQQMRPGATPPLQLLSDGTVF